MLPLVLAMLAVLHAPTTYAGAIAFVAEHDAPPAGMTREMGAALLVVTAWEEGRMCTGCKRGDGERSATTWQVRSWSKADADALDANPIAAARRAYYVMRAGARLCPDHPLAPYAGGCNVPLARAISDRRMRAAEALTAARLRR